MGAAPLCSVMGNICGGGDKLGTRGNVGGRTLSENTRKNFDEKKSMTRSQYNDFRIEHIQQMTKNAEPEKKKKDELDIYEISYELYLMSTVQKGDKLSLCHSYPDPSDQARGGAEISQKYGSFMPGTLAGYRVGTPVIVMELD